MPDPLRLIGKHRGTGVLIDANLLVLYLVGTVNRVATLCERGMLVLTKDLDLYLALQERGADALNFNHIRVLG